MTGNVTWDELNSQPDAWLALIGRLDAGELALPVDVSAYDEFLLLGSGTSFYLARAIADWMSRRGWAARAVASCEVLLDPFPSRLSSARRLAIGFSRSGQSSELLLANRILKAAGFDLLGICCTAGSSLLNQVDYRLLISEGHEDGLVMLRSFTSMLIAAQWLFGNEADRTALRALPDAGRAMLAKAAALRQLAETRDYDRFVFLGSGPQHPLTQESALKIQEMAVATSEAYYSLDYRHGPKACADVNTVVTLFSLSNREHGLALARDIRALGATLIVIGTDAAAYADIAQIVLAPSGMSSGEASAAAMMIPVQLFAFATALRRGRNPDMPVNLSKVVVL